MALRKLLREVRLFSNCCDEDIDQLTALAADRRLPNGDVLFSLGDEAHELMVVASGAVQLEIPVNVLGQQHSIACDIVRRGSVVGWSCLAPGGRFTLTGRAHGDTSVVVFSRTDLDDLFERSPAFGRDVVKNALLVATLRIRRAHENWIREIQKSVEQRFR